MTDQNEPNNGADPADDRTPETKIPLPEQKPTTNAVDGGTQKHEATASDVSRELHWLEKLNIFGQLSLVVVGIVAACIYGCQLNVMQGQLDQMIGSGKQTDQMLGTNKKQLKALEDQAKQTRELAAQAKVQAEQTKELAGQAKVQAEQTKILAKQAIVQAAASKSSAEVAKESLISVQRAFVSAEPYLEPILEGDGVIRAYGIELQWTNSGTTPAKEFQVSAQHGEHLYGRERKINPSASLPSDSIPKSFLAPKGRYNSHIETLTMQEMNDLANLKTTYYFFGSARYKDIFSRTKEHVTLYCYVLNRDYGQFSDSGPSLAVKFHFKFDQCGTNNCIDDECKAK